MRIFNRYFSTSDLVLVLGDFALAILAMVAVRAVAYWGSMEPLAYEALWGTQGQPIAFSVILSFYYSDLYVIEPTMPTKELIFRLINGFGVACMIVGIVAYLIPGLGFENIYLLEMMIVGAGLFLWRLAAARAMETPRAQGRLVIVGTRRIARLVAEELCRRKHLGIRVIGFVGPKCGKVELSYGNPVRVSLPVFPQQSTFEVVEREGVTRILVEAEDSCSDFPAQELVTLRLKGMPIEDCHTFYERLTSRIPTSDLHPGWIALSRGFSASCWVLTIKRLMDLGVSVVGLIVTAPIALVTAIAIKLDSPGPILFCQERAGQNERPFTLYKFRSMVQNAEQKTGPIWATVDDPRATRVGRIIRKLRIDEIPQMINVLKGEMSFVGPRPERPYFVNKLKEKYPYYHLRFAVKPGITGWAQVLYDYSDTEDSAIRKLEYDLYYLKYMSPFFDLQILFETLKVVIFGRGAH